MADYDKIYDPNAEKWITRPPGALPPDNSYEPAPPYKPDTSSYQYTNPIVDPYISGLMESALKTGNVADVASMYFRPEEYYRGEEERRAEELGKGVTAAGEAAVKAGTIAAERGIQKQGKLGSSALVYGEGGLLDVSEAAKLQSQAQMSQGLLDIYGQVGGERLQRESMGTGVLQTVLGIKSAEKIAFNPETGKPWSFMETEARLALEREQTINPATKKPYTNEEAIEQLSILRATNINPLTGMPWTAEQAQAELALHYAININPATGLPYSNEEFMAQLKQGAIQFDISTAEGQREFDNMMSFRYDEMNLTNAQAWAIFEKTMEVQIREQDINIQQFAESMDYAREKDYYDDKRIRDLTVMALVEDARRHKIDTEYGFTMWLGNLKSTMATVGAQLGEQHWYAVETLKQSLETIKDNRMATIINSFVKIAEDPILAQGFFGVTFDDDGNPVYDDTRYLPSGEVVLKGDANYDRGITKSDMFMGIMIPALSDAFYTLYDLDENGYVDVGEGKGVQFSANKIMGTVFENIGIAGVTNTQQLNDFLTNNADWGGFDEFDYPDMPETEWEPDTSKGEEVQPKPEKTNLPEIPAPDFTMPEEVKKAYEPTPQKEAVPPKAYEEIAPPAPAPKKKPSDYNFGSLPKGTKIIKNLIDKELRLFGYAFYQLPTAIQKIYINALEHPEDPDYSGVIMWARKNPK